MASPPPPYDDITGISRTVMKDNAQESVTNYNGNARPGEIVVNLLNNDVYIGDTNGNLNLLVIGGGSGNSEPAGPVGAIQYNSGGNLFGGTANVIVSGTGISVVGNVTAGNIVADTIVSNGSGNIFITGNLLPSVGTLNLGLPTLPWQDAYFGPQSITILDESGNIGNSVVIENIAANIVIGTTGFTINRFGTTTPVFRIEALTGQIFSNAETIIANVNNSSNATSGSLQTAGGAGIAKNLYVGNNIVTNGNLDVNGNLTFTGGGIRQTGNQDLFITAVDNDGVTISSIGLMPDNKHTRLEQWSGQYSESWTTVDWATGTYTVESGQGVVRFTNAANIISFVDSLYGSERIFLSVNGGPQLVSEGFDDSSGNIVFYTPTLPATNPTTVTTFDYYYSYESGLDIDYDSEEFNIFGDNVNINIETVGQKLINIKSFNDLNLESRNLFTLKNRSANNGIQIQTNASNSGPTWEFGADGTTTFPANGVVALNGNTTVAAGKTLTVDGVATFNDSIVRNGTDSVVVDIVPGIGQIIAEANSPTIIYLTTDDSVIATDLTVIIQYDGNNDTYTEITKLLVTKDSNIANQPNLVVAGQSLTTNSIAPGSYTAGRYAGDLIYVEVTTAPATGNSYVTVKATEFGGYYGV
jgi:hypothetical protein